MIRIPAAAAAATLARVAVRTDFLPMTGGLDLHTPQLQRRSGSCLVAQNFEAVQQGGYRRTGGYERFDGRPPPSSALYTIIPATIFGSVAIGNAINGATSGATAVVVALPGGQVVLARVVGTFLNGEALRVGVTGFATATGPPVIGGAGTPLLDARYLNLAADEMRKDIAAVPGSGPILGVWLYNDVVYAFRNNADATAAVMHRSSPSGWQAVALGMECPFRTGTSEIVVGNTVTGATSGASGVVTRVVRRTGTWGSDARGILVFETITGTFASGENLQVASVTRAVADGASAAITLSPGGRFEFVNHNFFGGMTLRMYGCDRVNRAFEFDGTTFVPLPTGMAPDTPRHIIAHMGHLFLSFGSSVQHSGILNPYAWSPLLGAAEIGMGDMVTAFSLLPGSEQRSALAIFTRQRTDVLYGNSAADWQRIPYRDGLGAYAYTVQDVGLTTMFLDDRGITDLHTTADFGNFAHATISDHIRSLVATMRLAAVASCISRDHSQYRLFMTGGRALYVTLARRRLAGIMPQLFAHDMTCVVSGERGDGSEAIYAGAATGGWVFQMERGTSFDGEPITGHIELSFDFQRAPRMSKRYRSITTEVASSGHCEFQLGYALDYGSVLTAQPADQTVALGLTSMRWDMPGITWENFVFDGRSLAPNNAAIDNEGENISVIYRFSSDEWQQFTISGAIVQYTPRRRLRE